MHFGSVKKNVFFVEKNKTSTARNSRIIAPLPYEEKKPYFREGGGNYSENSGFYCKTHTIQM